MLRIGGREHADAYRQGVDRRRIEQMAESTECAAFQRLSIRNLSIPLCISSANLEPSASLHRLVDQLDEPSFERALADG
jgi:hypothetical protein